MSTDCLKTKLKAVVNNSNLPVFDTIFINVTPGTGENIVVVKGLGVTIDSTGTLRDYQSNIISTPKTLENAYELYCDCKSADNTGVSKVKISIKGLTKVNKLNLGKGITSWNISNLCSLIKCTDLGTLNNSFTSNVITGEIKEFVQTSVTYGRTSGIRLSGQQITFNNTQYLTATGQTYYIKFNDANTVTVYKGADTSGTLLGSYNKNTGEWTYE